MITLFVWHHIPFLWIISPAFPFAPPYVEDVPDTLDELLDEVRDGELDIGAFEEEPFAA